jgi:drug/metabolite transporter (DMT)-like permease
MLAPRSERQGVGTGAYGRGRVGIALGLTAALCWGLSDVCATFASRRAHALGIVLAFHGLSIAALAIAAGFVGGLGDITLEAVLVLLGNGVLGAGAYVFFYRALAIGPISIVSPIVSGYAAITVLLAVLVLGERLNAGELAAVVIAFAGVVLASADVRELHRIERRELRGILLAVLAMVWIGVFLFWIAYYTDELGWLVPILLGRVFTAVFLLAAALPRREWRLAGGSRLVLGLIAAIATLDTVGYVVFNLGVQRAETSLVATAAAPYAIVPIVVGVAFLRERPAPSQWLGVAAVIGAMILLGVSA